MQDLMTAKVAPGEQAPDFALPRLEPGAGALGQPLRRSDVRGDKPVALIFGSYTCPPFRVQLEPVSEIHRRHGEAVAFLLVYIREAHPLEGWRLTRDRKVGIEFHDPGTPAQRAEIAGVCAARLGVEMPVLVDLPDNEVARRNGGWPIRLYLIDRDGRIAYRGREGPFGFRPRELVAAIEAESGAHLPRVRSGRMLS